MRALLAVLILSVALPAYGADKKSPKAACSTRCSSNYQFCLNRSTTKNGKKSCKADHKTCKKQCGGR
jgi:hypothetical protein